MPKYDKMMLDPSERQAFCTISLEMVVEKFPYRGIGDFHAIARINAAGTQQGSKQGRNEGEVSEIQVP